MKWEWIMGFSKYNEFLRSARKLLDRNLRPAVVATYRPLLETKARILLAQVLADPDELENHLYWFVASLWCRRLF